MAFNDDNEMQFEVLSSSSCEEKVCIEKNEIDIEVEKLAEFNWILVRLAWDDAVQDCQNLNLLFLS